MIKRPDIAFGRRLPNLGSPGAGGGGLTSNKKLSLKQKESTSPSRVKLPMIEGAS
jgi:hypothetical protein